MLEVEIGGSWSETSSGKKRETLSEKQTKAGLAQVIDHLPLKFKALSSNPSLNNNNNNNKKKNRKKMKRIMG
jgi:molybdopterin converting factor small subunit